MTLRLNEVKHGFKLIEEREIKEISSKAYVFEHEKSGARLIKIDNDDDNKVFSIGFRTPPEDSTGLTHILEHSVLCGSRKFNTKEPFVELLKGSLNTFLNAMTYPDKTIYPVASRNEKDYFNLMDVYMDAVLYPNIYKHPEIFMQEGWHYNIEEPKDELTYNGVVYNEMKGAYSSPESLMYRMVTKTVLPDTPYKEASGGDPEVIPDLTYEKFVNYHKKYYHPSNSYILLYGDGQLEKELKFLNENYLSDFDKIDVKSSIPTQKPFESLKEHSFEYGISEEDTLEDKTYLNLNFVVGKADEGELALAFEILTHMLLKTPAAPLKKALLDNGIGKAVSGEYSGSTKQPILTIVAKNCNEKDKDRFKEVVYSTLQELVDKGIDKETIEASINRIEFELREGEYDGYPKGLIHYTRIMDSWLYEGDPFVHLEYDKYFESIKSALKTNYFEALIKKYILDNKHSSFIILKPKKGLNEEKQKALKDKLDRVKNTLSEVEIKTLIDKCKALKERQNTADTEEALASIPMLSIEDIDRKAEILPLEERNLGGVKVLYHKLFTNKISYLNLYFNCKGLISEDVVYVRFLADILGKLDTKNYNYGNLSNKININTGGIAYSPVSYSLNGKEGEYTPYLLINLKTLLSKLEDGVDLLGEIIQNTVFDKEDRLLQIIKEIRSRIEGRLIDNGHRLALRKILAYCTEKGKYDEITLGLTYYQFLCDLEDNFDSKKSDIISKLKVSSEAIFNKNNLVISYSSEEEDYDVLEKIVPKLLSYLGVANISKDRFDFGEMVTNEGLLTQGNVQYVAKGGNFIKKGFSYHGSLNVLETISGFDYLWNNVRVKGGAYGVFANFRRDGGAYIVSYRDPNIKETIKVYDEMKDYLNNFTSNEREMTKYIIGTVRKLDYPLTTASKAEVSSANYFSNITSEDIQRERDEVLKTDDKTIRSFAPLVESVMNEDLICVVGNENKIKENKELFNTLEKVIK
ncbi:insulinase family protein [Clostridium sp. YIM B02505]|uniref:Insulinase family protein n=1 Tax=Clostridium yunnanense TaxID=2800325 RepID=A0ABS1EVZ5_9CLOT|nr:insulinase family protein [Clostridium yunnanense]MBK1813563.1 insulinase family protein [Clostridium yunnanense]